MKVLLQFALAFVWAVVYLPLVSGQTDPPTNPAAPQEAPTPAPSQPPQQQQQQQPQQNEQAVKALTERCFVALDQIVPGKFEENSETAASFRKIAEQFVRGEFDAARTQLEELCAAQPTLPPSPLLISAMLIAVGQTDAAVVQLEKAAVAAPDYPGIYIAFSRLALLQRRWSDAAAELKEARRTIDAGTWNEDQKKAFETDYLDSLAEIALGREQFDVSRQHLLELQKLLPDNFGVVIRLANIDFRQDKIDAARENLRIAHEMDKESVLVPELTLYQWSQGAGKWDEARHWISQAAANHGEDPNVQFEYARHLLEVGNPADSTVWLEKAEKSGANSVSTRFLRGQIAYYRGTFQAAEAEFKELNTQHPNDFGAKNMLALSLIESSEPARKQNALLLATSNLQAQPNNTHAASTLAWVYYRIGQGKQAAQLFNQVVSSPNVPTDSAYFVANLMADEGQYERAVALLKQALATTGLFLNRQRAQDFLAEIEKRIQATPPANKPTGGGS